MRVCQCNHYFFQWSSNLLSVFRSYHGTEGGSSQSPDSNRYMELLVIKLCGAYQSPVKQGGKRVERWTQISRAYIDIRELVISCSRVMDNTNITLYSINKQTLTCWYNRRTRNQEKQMLEQNIRLPESGRTARTKLPPSMVKSLNYVCSIKVVFTCSLLFADFLVSINTY